MPRKFRLDAAGVLHHVIVRGIERRPIFLTIADRRDFFERCGKLFPETGTSCYAWAFLSNHVHLLLRTGKVPLSKVMARLLSGYAARFNRIHKRSGHLFQNRYKSIICQEENYFEELVRYIHLNPIRAQLDLGHQGTEYLSLVRAFALLGRRTCEWQDTVYTLSSSAMLPHTGNSFRKASIKATGTILSEEDWCGAMEDGPRSRNRPCS